MDLCGLGGGATVLVAVPSSQRNAFKKHFRNWAMILRMMSDCLQRSQDQMRISFEATPNNEDGKLVHAAVRYALHGYFVQQQVGMSAEGLLSAMISKKRARQMQIFEVESRSSVRASSSRN